jgi:hypothetical protein
MSCFAKSQATSTPPDSGCLGKADAKFAAAVAKADTQGPCPTTQPEAAIEGAADFCVNIFLLENNGLGKCPAAISKATGKAVSAELSCSAKDITKPGSFGACETKSNAKFSQAFGKAGNCGPNETAIQFDIDGCRLTIQSLTPATTTTSTSTTTTTL